jgi:hypothetical protein
MAGGAAVFTSAQYRPGASGAVFAAAFAADAAATSSTDAAATGAADTFVATAEHVAEHAEGYRGERPEEVRPAIRAALSSPRPARVEAIVDPDEKPTEPDEQKVCPRGHCGAKVILYFEACGSRPICSEGAEVIGA